MVEAAGVGRALPWPNTQLIDSTIVKSVMIVMICKSWVQIRYRSCTERTDSRKSCYAFGRMLQIFDIRHQVGFAAQKCYT